jgi:hypothetical protein
MSINLTQTDHIRSRQFPAQCSCILLDLSGILDAGDRNYSRLRNQPVKGNLRGSFGVLCP